MIYNGHATNQDCVSEILKICGATTATYPLVDITRRFNSGLDRYFSLAFKAGKKGSFDDFNQTDAPIDTQNIVSGTNKYQLSDFTDSVIGIIGLEILDSAGNGHKLIKENVGEIATSFQEEYLNAPSGTPTHYTKLGDFVYLKPSPDYNSTGGLKAYIERPALYMASTDTTKVPGVPVIHHTYLCRYASLPFLIENRLPQAQAVAQQIILDEQSVVDHFGVSSLDEPSRITPKYHSNK